MKDGGPAFPCTQENTNNQGGCTGISVRDYFAGQALAGVIIQTQLWETATERKGCDYVEAVAKDFAEEAYAIADAMLKAREEEPR